MSDVYQSLASISTATTLVTTAGISVAPGRSQTGSSRYGPLAYPVLKGLNAAAPNAR
jgi:hypothetical protein